MNLSQQDIINEVMVCCASNDSMCLDDLVVTGVSALVLRGVLQTTDTVEVAVSSEYMNHLRHTGAANTSTTNQRIAQLTSNILAYEGTTIGTKEASHLYVATTQEAIIFIIRLGKISEYPELLQLL